MTSERRWLMASMRRCSAEEKEEAAEGEEERVW